MGLQESIHPRNYFPPDKRRKKNTCKAPSRKRVQRLLASLEEHHERHPRDDKTAARIAKVKAQLASLPVRAEPEMLEAAE